jgi:glycosyltransferase involved in cell wall biosynthesis
LKRIYLVITPFFPTKENFRGPYVLDQVKAIQKESNYNVTVLRPKPMFSKAQDYDFEGVIVHYFKKMSLPSGILPGLFSRINQYLFLKRIKFLGINYKNIAIVHAHVTENGFYANTLKRKCAKIKTVLQHHGFDVLSLENGILRTFKAHHRWVKQYGIKICNAMDLHIGVSQKTLNFLTEGKDIKPKATHVLYNGVDYQKFYPIVGLKDINVFKIGCIANFWPLKDQMTLIKAAEQLINKGMSNLKVVFIGTGALLESCMTYVETHKMESHITFQREVAHEELNGFYNTLDLFVLPSYYEAFGCVYTEAYACGVPFMAVKDQGIAELIAEAEKDRWLIDKGSYSQLAQKIAMFHTYRYEQKLKYNHEIEVLIATFLKMLKSL